MDLESSFGHAMQRRHSAIAKSNVLVGVDAMPDDKSYVDAHELVTVDELHDFRTRSASEQSSEFRDQQDMRRMGRVQQVRRVFRKFSLWSFTCIIFSTWEYLMLAVNTGLSNSGRGGLFWTFLDTFFFSLFMCASMGEMASMAPIAGGQYHWVSEFAPRKSQRYLSYVTGWASVLFWQIGFATSNMIAGTLVEQLIILYRPDYELIPWRSTLMALVPLTPVILFNLFGHTYLPMLQNLTVILHVFGAVLVMLTLWVTAPHVSAREVILDFPHVGSYSGLFIGLMIGPQQSNQWSMAPMDGSVHMAEEVNDASITVPQAMMHGLWFNGVLGFLVLVTFLFALPNVNDALNSPAGPFLYVLQQAWPGAGYSYCLWVLTIVITLGNVPYGAANARLMFALARDGGMPFSKSLAHVHPRIQVPINAILATTLLTVIMNFVKLGSVTAFDALASITSVCQMSTFGLSVGCILWRRLTRPQSLPLARWSLGRWGVPINIVAIFFAINTLFWAVWPMELPVTVQNFNFGGPIAAGFVLCCTITYHFYGKKVYFSPRDRIKSE